MPRNTFAWSRSQPEIHERQQDQAALEVAAGILVAKGYGVRPARVLQSVIDLPTSRTTTFRTQHCSVSFDPATRTATWDVPQGNHACEHARSSPLARAFFAAIGKVRWTYGTGGVIAGNDENASSTQEAYGGGNYVRAAYGYLGIKQAPMHVGTFTNAKGQQVTVKVKAGRAGLAGKQFVTSPRDLSPGGRGQGRTRRGGPARPRLAFRNPLQCGGNGESLHSVKARDRGTPDVAAVIGSVPVARRNSLGESPAVVLRKPDRPRGLPEPCAATSGKHGSEEGGAKTAPPIRHAPLCP